MTEKYGPLLKLVYREDLKSFVERHESSNLLGATKLRSTKDVPSKQELEQIVSKHSSIRKCLLALGFSDCGNSRILLRSWIKTNDIDTTHFTGQLWSKGKSLETVENIFTMNSFRSTDSVKKRIIKDGLIAYKCSDCQISEWRNQKLVLELDHVDGNHMNNSLENLRFLCPNCHSQSSTFRGKNIAACKRRSSNIPDDVLLDAIKKTDNLRKALLKVGLSPRGGNYARCYRLLSKS